MKILDSMAAEAPHFFQGEMVPWLSLHVRRSKAGGMHLINCKELKTGKDLKCPAARLTCPVRPVLSRPIISLEKNGGLRCLENQSDILCKNLTGHYWKNFN